MTDRRTLRAMDFQDAADPEQDDVHGHGEFG
jgi:hypothetical protein